MFLSRLKINGRCRQVISELECPYEMHRTISKAFGDDADNYKDARCMFRVDETIRPTEFHLLVQSSVQPDWNKLTVADGYLLKDPESREVNLALRDGQALKFRLRANPTVKKNGKRFGLVSEEDQIRWLMRKSEVGGFRVIRLSHRKGQEVAFDMSGKGKAKLWSVQFDGILQVTDPDVFKKALETGVGSAKAFGFGMLSIAPVR